MEEIIDKIIADYLQTDGGDPESDLRGVLEYYLIPQELEK